MYVAVYVTFFHLLLSSPNLKPPPTTISIIKPAVILKSSTLFTVSDGKRKKLRWQLNITK